MRKIVLYPNKILRQKTKEIVKVDSKLLKDIEMLREILATTANGAGLAAVQIGLNRRFLGIKAQDGKGVSVLINPKIMTTYGKKEYLRIVDSEGKSEDFLEGCLSFPNLFGTVKRFISVEAGWQEIKSKPIPNPSLDRAGHYEYELIEVKKTLNGYESIVFQHELDHLNGVVFIDHIKKDGGKLYRQVGEKMELVTDFI